MFTLRTCLVIHLTGIIVAGLACARFSIWETDHPDRHGIYWDAR